MEQWIVLVVAPLSIVGLGFFILSLYRTIVRLQAQIDFLYKRVKMHEIRLEHLDGIKDDGEGPLYGVTDYWPRREKSEGEQ